jgi:class 3 adenylate cyclase
MSTSTKKLAILFADISGSTALYEQLGDQTARQLISNCLSLLKATLPPHNGMLIKTIGDEILCTFPTPEAAMNAACEMQMAVKSDNQHNNHSMYIRIGFHYGDVICEDGDIYGDAVNVAARVTAITRANQIMTTTAVFNLLPLSVHDKVRNILRADIKGKQEQLDIYQVMWELEDMGSTRIGMSAYRKPKTNGNELLINFASQTYTLNEVNKKLLLGRESTCEIMVRNDFVSRQHANIEFKSGKFILSDHSSNGTYIRSGGNTTRLNREDLTLLGTGIISLGQPFSDQAPDLIEYSVVDS